MDLILGATYSHTTGSGVNKCVYSHSDDLKHNHIFTVTRNVKGWILDGNNQVSLPTWDLQRNISKDE